MWLLILWSFCFTLLKPFIFIASRMTVLKYQSAHVALLLAEWISDMLAWPMRPLPVRPHWPLQTHPLLTTTSHFMPQPHTTPRFIFLEVRYHSHRLSWELVLNYSFPVLPTPCFICLLTCFSSSTRMKNVLFLVRTYVLFKSVGRLVGIEYKKVKPFPCPRIANYVLPFLIFLQPPFPLGK